MNLPLSQTTGSVKVSDITVGEDRQRKDLITGIEELAASIARNGLIQPIVISAEGVLVAGERRLTAIRKLGWTSLKPHQFRLLSSLSLIELEVLELEENAKRQALTWQENANAVLRIHELQEQLNEDWNQSDTARMLCSSTQTVGRNIIVAEAMKTNSELAKIASLSTAYATIQRDQERRLHDSLSDISSFLNPEAAAPPPSASPVAYDLSAIESIGVEASPSDALLPAEPKTTEPLVVKRKPLDYTPGEKSILNSDFIEWSKTYKGPKYNFLHCDFPYDAGAGRSGSQINSGGDLGTYEDSKDIFLKLCDALIESFNNVIAKNAHIMFWYATEQHDEVWNYFNDYSSAHDFRVFRIPLVWHKTDNTGVLSDASRRARHIYETALVISRGDRKIVKSVADVYGCPTSRSIHPAEKPQPMLQHFFTMFVSDTTRFLDPTCGSGMSLRAAETLGAKHVLGFELDEGFHKEATQGLTSFRRKRALAEEQSK